jgi:hypothetical protein
MKGAERLRVCKHAFRSILNVGDCRIGNIAKKVLRRERVELDGRGKHGMQPKFDNGLKEAILAHIHSFPRDTSHYTMTSTQEYLDAALSVRQMHRLYLEKHEPLVFKSMVVNLDSEEEQEEELQPAVKYAMYLLLFNETGLKIGGLKVDSCGVCDEFKVRIQAAPDEKEKARLAKDHEAHLKIADDSYARRKQDQATALEVDVEEKELPFEYRSVAGTESISSDFMGNICVPKLSAGETYYMRKLKLFNYGVHIGSVDRHSMYFWDEKQGRKTSNDILSAVHACLTDRATGRTNLHWWSDNTKSQVKCWQTVKYCLELTRRDSIHMFDRIDALFPPVGHTFLENDRGFSTVSRAAKKITTIASKADYMTIAKKASKTNPIRVEELTQPKHRDFEAFLSQFYTQRLNGFNNADGEKVLLDEIRWIKYEKGRAFYRHSFEDTEAWKRVAITRCVIDEPKPLSDPGFDLYVGPLEIDFEKTKDLHKMARKYLKAEYHHLYPAPEDKDAEEEEEEEDHFHEQKYKPVAGHLVAIAGPSQQEPFYVAKIVDVDETTVVVHWWYAPKPTSCWAPQFVYPKGRSRIKQAHTEEIDTDTILGRVESIRGESGKLNAAELAEIMACAGCSEEVL